MAAIRLVCIAAGIVPCISKVLSSPTSVAGVAPMAARLVSGAQSGRVPVAPGRVASGGIVPKVKVLAKL